MCLRLLKHEPRLTWGKNAKKTLKGVSSSSDANSINNLHAWLTEQSSFTLFFLAHRHCRSTVGGVNSRMGKKGKGKKKLSLTPGGYIGLSP